MCKVFYNYDMNLGDAKSRMGRRECVLQEGYAECHGLSKYERATAKGGVAGKINFKKIIEGRIADKMGGLREENGVLCSVVNKLQKRGDNQDMNKAQVGEVTGWQSLRAGAVRTKYKAV